MKRLAMTLCVRALGVSGCASGEKREPWCTIEQWRWGFTPDGATITFEGVAGCDQGLLSIQAYHAITGQLLADQRAAIVDGRVKTKMPGVEGPTDVDFVYNITEREEQ